MLSPPRWTDEQLDTARTKAEALFRQERLSESLDVYLKTFDTHRIAIEALLAATDDLANLNSAASKAITDPRLLEVFRYAAAPPISTDDPKILAETGLSKRALLERPSEAKKIVRVIRSLLDPRRFTWLLSHAKPNPAQREAAVVATAALMAVRTTETRRRNEGKTRQEAGVKAALEELGFRGIPARNMATIADGPEPGTPKR